MRSKNPSWSWTGLAFDSYKDESTSDKDDIYEGVLLSDMMFDTWGEFDGS